MVRVHPRRLACLAVGLLAALVAVVYMTTTDRVAVVYVTTTDGITTVQLTHGAPVVKPGDAEWGVQEMVSDVRRDALWGVQEAVSDMRRDALWDVQEMVSKKGSTKHSWQWPEARSVLIKCADIHYDDSKLVPVSVIVTFCDNENLYSLLHTVHSIVENSPVHLLAEVILIDDGTRKASLKAPLSRYLAGVLAGSVVRLYRSPRRLGLITARLTGIRLATAAVVVVMDSHVEVQRGWLRPLLHEISVNGKTLASSCLDWIEKKGESWEYRHGGSDWKTYFDWTFTFGFQRISLKARQQRSVTDPITCPVTVGTIFAINTTFFHQIGAFDDGMRLWGGENLDLPVRVWLFGGRVLNVPCSRAAHLEYPNNRDYRRGWGHVVQSNYKRFAEVWLGDYRKYFYDAYPHMKDVDAGNLDSRLQLRHKAVHNFSWYLAHVYPEIGLPDRDSFAWGRIENLEHHTCLDSGFGVNLQLRKCRKSAHSQNFYWSEAAQLRQPVHVFAPLDVGRYDNGSSAEREDRITRLDYIPLYRLPAVYRWLHWKGGPLVDESSGRCLMALDAESVTVARCDRHRHQTWSFQRYTPAYRHMRRATYPRAYSDIADKVHRLNTAHAKPAPLW